MIQMLPIELLCIEGMQMREEMNQEAIEDMTALLEADPKYELPPGKVFHDAESGIHRLADGLHRRQAYIQAGRRMIPEEIEPGTEKEAMEYAATANSTHGVRRTNADKNFCVRKFLADARWSNLGDRALAAICGVSHTYVSDVRVLATNTTPGRPKHRTGSDGRTYKARKPKKSAGVGPKKRWVLCAMCAKGVKPKVVPCPTCERNNNPKGYADTVVPGGERYDWDEFETAYGVLALFHPKVIRCYGKLVDQKVYEQARLALVAFLDSMQKLQKICTGRLNNTTARTQKT